MNVTLKSAALAATFALGVGAADAATVTFDFTTAGSGRQTLLSYTMGGLTMDVTATGGAGKVQTWKWAGLGSPDDGQHQVDSKGVPETINFAFSQAVKLVTVTFNPTYVQPWDSFALSQGGAVLGSPLGVVASVDVSDLTTAADSFGVGAVGVTLFSRQTSNPNTGSCFATGWYDKTTGEKNYRCYSAFKITSLTVDYDDTPPPSPVPLPAAGWLLMAGLGGFAALRRRRG